MLSIEPIADAALRRDSLALRALTQAFLQAQPTLSNVPPPTTGDQRTMIVAAALLELLALRIDQAPPAWTAEVGSLPTPFFLVEAATRLRRLRALCEAESPEPLRRRRLFAPPNFLEFA